MQIPDIVREQVTSALREPMLIGRRRGGTAPPPPSTAKVVLWLLVGTVLIQVASHFTAPEIRLPPFLIFLPYLIAGVGTVKQTLIAAVWVNVVLLGSLIYQPPRTFFGAVTFVLFGLGLGALSLWRCRERIAREAEIYRLRSASAVLQQQVLLPLPWRTREVVADGLYEPLTEESRIGGDLYDIVASPYGTRVLIADVQGKGLYAIGAAFAVLGTFREAAHRERALSAVATALDEAVVRHNDQSERMGRPERFVTALVLCIDDGVGATVCQAVNCGHVPMYRLHRGRAVPALRGAPGVPLGLGPLTGDPREAEWFDFPFESTLLLFTDGVTEARSPSGAFFPLVERLPVWSEVPAADLVGVIRSDLRRFTHGEVSDDIAVLTLRHAAAG